MTKGEQARLMAWRLRVLQQAADEENVSRVCRRFGLSRKSFYKWKRRRAVHGDAGLCDRPRTPRRSPRATAGEVVSKILYLRQHYHFGPGRIAAYLLRFHAIKIAISSVHRILTRMACTGCRPIRSTAPTASGGSATRNHSPVIDCSSM